MTNKQTSGPRNPDELAGEPVDEVFTDTLIDILLPVHNGERFLSPLISSVLAQDYPRIRLLICDDHSSDGSSSLIEDWVARDERIEVIRSEERHGSAQRAFMYLLSESRAPYIMFCDQDDVWLPGKISESLRVMRVEEKRTNVLSPVLIFSDACVVDRDLKEIHRSFMGYSRINPKRNRFAQLLVQNTALGCTCMLNRALVSLVRETPSEINVGMHDHWCALVAASFGSVKYLDRATLLYRQHDLNVVGAKKWSLFRLERLTVYKESVKSSYGVARAFIKVYGDRMPWFDAQVLRKFIELEQMAPLARVARIVHYRLLKGDIGRILGQLLVALLTPRGRTFDAH